MSVDLTQLSDEALRARYDLALQQYFADLDTLTLSEMYVEYYERELDRREKEDE